MRIAYRIKNFSPFWFAALMGVGITAAILHNFPFEAHWLRVFGIVVWGIAIAMYVVFTTVFVLRFVLYPDQFWRMLHHPGQSVFLGCYPMGFATIINMTHFIWGHKAWVATYVMWWVDVVLSLASTWGVVFVTYAYHGRSLESLNATIILPVVPVVVAAATGGVIAAVQPAGLQPSSVIISFLLWANGQAVAACCICVYIYRMLRVRLPPRAIAFSALLNVGPLGQGAFGIQCIADVLCTILRRQGVNEGTVEAIRYMSIFAALALVAFATFWIVVSVFSSIYLRPTQFHPSWWSLTFPVGTYVVAWYQLGAELEITTFKVIGAVFGVIVALNVLMCSVLSIYHALFKDTLFSLVQSETDSLADDDQSKHTSSAADDNSKISV
ncbi:sulfite efflux pump Ssu1p [Trichomonascus vanleenenianus]|uniref:Ssu1p n=1 Tax=Trichomonascus vanleenenianus TaxID=2268995 RepID=UPI003ECB26AF